jgi:hypothetical protein
VEVGHGLSQVSGGLRAEVVEGVVTEHKVRRTEREYKLG